MTFTDPSLHQRHSYGASKYLDEIACQHAVREGLDVRIVRPFNAYGPRLLGDEYGQVVAMFFNAILNNQPIEIHNGGEQTRSFTWIADIVDGSSLSGTALNIGSTEEVSILALQEQMFSLVKASSWARPMPEVRYTEGYHGDAKRRLPDCSISENLIGWKPQTNLIQGLSAMWNQLS